MESITQTIIALLAVINPVVTPEQMMEYVAEHLPEIS